MYKRNKHERMKKTVKTTKVNSAKVKPNFTGQHLLHNPKTVKRMLELARLKRSDTVLEIGAGKGVLTFPLAEQAGKVIAVEVDESFSKLLRSKVADKACSNISIKQADIRTFRLPVTPFTVVANIPYSITTPILDKLLGAEGRSMQRAVLMVEKGAAKRFTQAATMDTRLLMWKMFFIFKLESVIPRTHFAPPPSVDSAILSIKRRDSAYIPAQEARRFVAFAAYVLSVPQLSVALALKGIFTAPQLKKVLLEAGLHREQTVQEIELEQWGTLFNAMLKHVPAFRWPK